MVNKIQKEVCAMTNTTVERKTQVQMFKEIRSFLEVNGAADEMVEFLDGRIELLENQAARAKERKASKAKPEDAMLAAVAACMSDKLKTGEEIAEELSEQFPEISRSKVVARLKVLVDQGIIGKVKIKAGAGRTVMAYALAEYIPVEDAE